MREHRIALIHYHQPTLTGINRTINRSIAANILLLMYLKALYQRKETKEMAKKI